MASVHTRPAPTSTINPLASHIWLSAADSTPGPGSYPRGADIAACSKYSQAPGGPFGSRTELPPPTRHVPGPGAYSPSCLPNRADSRGPCFTFHGAPEPLRGDPVPGPGSYNADKAVAATRPLGRAATMHPRLQAAYLPKVEAGPTATSYSPAKPCVSRAASFSRGTGHRDMAAEPSSGGGSRESPAPTAYDAGYHDISQLRSRSFTFGTRPALRDPTAAVPGPGAYQLE